MMAPKETDMAVIEKLREEFEMVVKSRFFDRIFEAMAWNDTITLSYTVNKERDFKFGGAWERGDDWEKDSGKGIPSHE